MDQTLVYVKTPAGEDVVRQRTRAVQRNLRPVLILVDGKTTVAELAAKVDNAKLVEDGLRELEKGGFIILVQPEPSVFAQEDTVGQEGAAEMPRLSTPAPESVQPAEIESSGIIEKSVAGPSADFGTPPMPSETPEALFAKPAARAPMAAAVAREGGGAKVVASPPKRSRPAASMGSLLKGGFAALAQQAGSVREQGAAVAQGIKATMPRIPASRQKPVRPAEINDSSVGEMSALSAFSDFGDPPVPAEIPKKSPPKKSTPKPPVRERTATVTARDEHDATEMAPSPRRFRPMMAVWGLLGLLVLSCLGVVFYPYNKFKPDIEATLGASFRAPVRVGDVAVVLLPRPALTLQKVEIGGQGEVRIDEIRIPSLLSLIGNGQRIIPTVEVSGLAMPADGLGLLLATGKDPAAGLAVGHARFKRMALRMGDFPLRNLEGEMSFAADGKLDKASLQTEDRTLRIEAVPTARGATLNIEGYGWKPVEGAPYVFESMQAKGVLLPGRLVLQDIDTTFLGGTLKGNWLLDWSKGMAMAGEASLARLSARRVADAFAAGFKIDGELSGALKLRGTGKDWSGMWANASASLDADIVRGVVTGIDLGEAARRGAGRTARGGATKFDRLRGAISVNPQQVAGRDIRLEAGLVSANGRFVSDRERRVDGLFDVSISSSVSGVRMPIKVSGTLPDLVVAAGR